MYGHVCKRAVHIRSNKFQTIYSVPTSYTCNIDLGTYYYNIVLVHT